MPRTPAYVRGASITGWGRALPDNVVTNVDLEKSLDTNDEWVRERTGIVSRHIGGSTASLSIESGSKALAMAGVDPSSIDALILATTTPDRTVPATSANVQNALGLSCGAFDVNAACSGFVYALVNAYGLIAMGAEKVLVIGTDTLSRITDWTDRNTAILFADGSGAAVVEAHDGPNILYCEVGGKIHMDGKEVFRRAVRIMVDSGQKSLNAAGITANDIALVVPHQANIRIINSACEKLGFPPEKCITVLHETGNTSSASIPLALFDAADNGRLKDGDLVLLVGFGAGMTAASCVIRWGN